MTEELYSKTRVLYDIICNLETQKKNILSNSDSIIDISLRKDSWFSPTTFNHISYNYLDSNRLKEFILNEINEKLLKLKEEFNKL